MEKGANYNPTTRWTNRPEQDNTQPPREAIFYTPARGAETAQSITFLLRGQRLHTIPTGSIAESYYSPEDGIILFCRTGTIQIEGRNLERLYRKIAARKVVEIREFSENAEQFFDKEALFISGIQYESENLNRQQLI